MRTIEGNSSFWGTYTYTSDSQKSEGGREGKRIGSRSCECKGLINGVVMPIGGVGGLKGVEWEAGTVDDEGSGGRVSQRLRCSGAISSRSTDIGRDGDQGRPRARISSKTPRISAGIFDRLGSWCGPANSGCWGELVELSNKSLIGRSRANRLSIHTRSSSERPSEARRDGTREVEELYAPFLDEVRHIYSRSH